MQKILLAIDGINVNRNALEFACYIARLTKSKITGVFLENVLEDEEPVLRRVHGLGYVDWALDEHSDEYISKMELIERNISIFKEGCINREVCFSVHRDRGVPALELIEESRFADVIIADPEISFSKRYEGIPTEFVRNILNKTECPVIIAPENFEAVDEIVFTYNGSSSSVFAIKQFTYLFPQLRERKVSIIQVNEEGQWEDSQKYKFKEWLKNHYTNLHFEVLKGEADSKLFDYIFGKKNIFLVMGAYGRNTLSRFFKRSRADVLIQTVTQPIFITHL